MRKRDPWIDAKVRELLHINRIGPLEYRRRQRTEWVTKPIADQKATLFEHWLCGDKAASRRASRHVHPGVVDYVVEHRGISRCDVKSTEPQINRDAWTVKLWNHRRIEITGKELFDAKA